MRQFGSFDVEEYRRRLKLLRGVFGENQTEFARRTGIAFKKWNHYERGYPLSREAAFILHEKIPGLDPSWIYWGYEGNLSVDLRDRIKKIEREEARAMRIEEHARALRRATPRMISRRNK